MTKRKRHPVLDSGDPVAIYDARQSGAIAKVPDGFWQDDTNARAVLEVLWQREGIDNPPMQCNSRWYVTRVPGLSRRFRHSPWLILSMLYPGRYEPTDFPKFPNAEDLQQKAYANAGIGWNDNPMRREVINRKLRKEARDECYQCSRPRLPGSSVCAKHLALRKAKDRKRWARLRAPQKVRHQTRTTRIRWSRENIIKAVQAYAKRGPVNASTVDKRLNGAIGTHFGSWREALEAAGLEPSQHIRQYVWTAELVLERLKERLDAGKPLTHKALRQDDRSLLYACHKYHSGVGNALKALGLTQAEIRRLIPGYKPR